MDELVTVLSVSIYDFTNSTGDEVSGCTVMYYPSDNFNKVEDEKLLGLQPLKATFQKSFFDEAKKVGIPCKAKVHYVMKSSQGKKYLSVDGLDFIK